MASLTLRTLRILNKPQLFRKLDQVRNSSYQSSPFLVDLGEINRKYEVSSNPEEWKYVERALPPTIIPEPKPKAHYPSGWKPQSGGLKDRPYFISRTKNHMVPVYLIAKQRGIRKLTYIRKIQGDIWALEKEIREFVQEGELRPIRSQVNEFAGYICIAGDYVNKIKYWLTQRGF